MTNLVPNKLKEEEMILVEGKSFDEERALYNLKEAIVSKCRFEGKADGESPLKEAKDVSLVDSFIDLRYSLWHNDNLKIVGTTLTSNARAPLWYSNKVEFLDSKSEAVKIFRECNDIIVQNSEVISEEPFWNCNDVTIVDSKIAGFYAFFGSNNVKLNHVTYTGKYSFQYMKNVEIIDSVLDTKDAFWHSKNIVVRNSVVKGEYLAWYSKNITFINCEIESHQGLCYCKNIKFVDCKFKNSDLLFENSTVKGNVIGSIDSIKNPIKCSLKIDEVKEIVKEKPLHKVRIKIKN